MWPEYCPNSFSLAKMILDVIAIKGCSCITEIFLLPMGNCRLIWKNEVLVWAICVHVT